MPIVEIKGDLLASDCTVIGHGCNCFHTMGSGIALAIRTKYPEVYLVDTTDTKKGDAQKLGTFTKVKIGELTIYNLYQQYRYGRDRVHLEYDKLELALRAMKQDLIDNKIYASAKIGLPRIGCSLAGGDWAVVSKIIEEIFCDITVYIYSL